MGNRKKMDVQTENTDPPPCESQPSGKIRKGFKLFGKRKPGNIFSIRSKGDGNNKSPVIRSKTSDGLSETTAPDSEQEPDKEKGQEVSQAEREQAEEEQLGEDGVLAAAPARTSISSASSAKSLSFLSLLRGGRRGVGDRRVHTVSQPVGRQRRGLKGLFGNVKFRSKDKEDKEEAPPSPLLMSSRANSVEIIKEDLTLTPKAQPRSLDSPDTESCEPIQNLSTQDSAATSPSEVINSQVTADNVSKTNEHAPPLPASEPPLVPGDNSLSSLLADISSLLTFDSISGGGDIMADVEAEWGKASSAIGAVTTEVTPLSTSLFSKPTIPSPVKLSHVAISTSSTQSYTPFTMTTFTSSPTAKPSTIITTLTKASTLTTHTATLSSDFTPVFESSTSIKVKPSAQPLTTHVALTSFSAPKTSSFLITNKPTESSTCTTTAPPNTPATVVKAPSISPTLTSTASKLASEISAPASVSKPAPVTPPVPSSAKPPPVAYPPPIPPPKLDSASSGHTSTSYKPSVQSGAGESKAPEKESPATPVRTTPFSPAPVILPEMTTATTSTTTSGSAALSKPAFTSPSSHLTALSSTPPITTKTQPSIVSVTTPSSTSIDKTPSITKSTLVMLDKFPPTPTPAPVPTTHAVISTALPTPADLGQIPHSHFKPPPVPAEITISVLKDSPGLAQVQVSQSKAPPGPVQTPISVSKHPPAPVQTPVSASKDPPAPTHISVSVSKAVPATPPAPCPVTSPSSTPALWSNEPIASGKMRASRQASVDGQLTSPSSTDAHGALTKTEELHESRTNLQGSSREKKTQQVKASGLSKIPVVGGGKAGKPPVRDDQHGDDEASKVSTTPVQEDKRPHLNSHDAGNRDKICEVEANVPTSKHTLEESQQPPQLKALSSLPRDSKIPVKHSTQSHTVSQIPQAKEPHRTKIPVSKVPVRRAGNKPAASGGSTQTRK